MEKRQLLTGGGGGKSPKKQPVGGGFTKTEGLADKEGGKKAKGRWSRGPYS